MRNFGFAGVDESLYLGTNGKMSEVSAAMGLTGLESLHFVHEANRRNYQLYQQQLAGLQGVRLFEYDDESATIISTLFSRSMTSPRASPATTSYACSKRKTFWLADISIRVAIVWSLTARCFPQAGSLLARTEALAERVLVLPTGSAVSAADVAGICQILHTALQFPGECRRLLDG